jgi:hypothetical protein
VTDPLRTTHAPRRAATVVLVLTSRRVLLPAAAVIAVIAGAVGLYLFQPWLLFVDEEVSEALPVAAAAASEEPMTEESMTEESMTEEPMDEEPMGEESMTDESMDGEATEEPMADEPSAPAAPPAGPVELARGELISHEHATTGTARVLQLEDGSRVLRLEGLDTSNGPDLRVWLTDAPVIEGRDGWFVFDDGASVDLGELKGNQGDANYEIPADVDLDALTSVSIWCARFAVSFGAAELA